MKKHTCMLLAVLLFLTGCQAGTGSETTSVPTETTVAPTVTTAPEEETTVPMPSETLPTEPAQLPGGSIAFSNPGKVRIAYQGNRSYVKYVTSVAELPDEEALAAYDEAFFENHALLIVVETTNSGSVQLELDTIAAEGNTAHVSLKRTMSGDFGTSDMATWMLWAEVDRGLDYTWNLESSSGLPGGEKY